MSDSLDLALAPELDLDNPRAVVIHGPEAFEGMRKAGRLVAECLDMLTPHVEPGVSTERLDDLAREFVLDHGAVPACLNYKGYRHTICTSINHVVCHGIPAPKRLREGDIVNIDVTLILDGWHGDHSRMYQVGGVKRLAERLVGATYEAMMAGIAAIKPGRTVGDIGAAIKAIADAERFSVVDDFCGHGIGRVFHAEPNVVHTGPAGTGAVLKEGMFFTVEPMINAGRADTRVLGDGWTAITRDRSLSAQFEHTVGVTADGVEIFTASPAGLDRPPYRT